MKSYFDLEKIYLSSEYEEETSVWTRIQKQKYRGNSDYIPILSPIHVGLIQIAEKGEFIFSLSNIL